MGGSVKVESKLGEGSTFSMNFKVMSKKNVESVAKKNFEYFVNSPNEIPRGRKSF